MSEYDSIARLIARIPSQQTRARAKHLLGNHKIETLDQLRATSPDTLLALKNCGRQTIDALRTAGAWTEQPIDVESLSNERLQDLFERCEREIVRRAGAL